MSKTQTLAFRIDTEQKNEVEKLAASFGLLPADIVRAAVQAVLVAVRKNGGQIKLPLHVRTLAEEAAWIGFFQRCDELTVTFPLEKKDGTFTDFERSAASLLNYSDNFAEEAGMPPRDLGPPKIDRTGHYEIMSRVLGLIISEPSPPLPSQIVTPPPVSEKPAVKRTKKK